MLYLPAPKQRRAAKLFTLQAAHILFSLVEIPTFPLLSSTFKSSAFFYRRVLASVSTFILHLAILEAKSVWSRQA
jgi:hypothetical protein